MARVTPGRDEDQGIGIGHNGGPPLPDDAKQRIEDRIKLEKHEWRRVMETLTQTELNEHWQAKVANISDSDVRERLAAIRLSPAQCNALKLLYGRLCDHMSADPDNDPGEAWPTQKSLAKALGWSERTVRTYLGLLAVLGYLWTHRTKRRPRQCVTRNHYRLRSPVVAYEEATGNMFPVPTGK